jgi:hypothetical protein
MRRRCAGTPQPRISPAHQPVLSSIHDNFRLSPRIQRAIERRFGELTLPPEAVEEFAGVGRTLASFSLPDDVTEALYDLTPASRAPDEPVDAPVFLYEMFVLFNEAEVKREFLPEAQLEEVLRDLGINPDPYVLMSLHSYFTRYFRREFKTKRRCLEFFPDGNARKYVRAAILNEAARLRRDEQIIEKPWVDGSASNIPRELKKAQSIYGPYGRPIVLGGDDYLAEFFAQEAGEGGSEARWSKEEREVLGDVPETPGEYAARARGTGRKKGRALETSAVDPRQTGVYAILKLMAQPGPPGTARDRQFARLILYKGYFPRDLSERFGGSSVRDFRRKVRRWLDAA